MDNAVDVFIEVMPAEAEKDSRKGTIRVVKRLKGKDCEEGGRNR